MASPRPSAPVEGTGPPRSLPGFAALLRPRTDSTHAHSDGGAEIYAPPSSVFASSFHNHFHPHQYGLLNLRPPVVASPPPSPFDSLGSYAMFKPRKLDVTTSPSSAARRTGPSSASSSSPSTSPPAPSSSATPLKHRGPHPRPSARTSRYLREIDRRAILERIAKGEKQADLAKEYQVSRAAISNLKQRRKVKERQLQRQGAGRPHGGDQDNDAADTEEEKGDEKEEEEGSTDRRRRHRHESSADNSSIPAPLTHNNAADAAAVRAVAALRVARQDPLAITPPASSSPAGDVSTSSISSACLVHTSSTAHLLKQLQHGNASSAVAAQRLARLLLEEALGRLPTREGAATRPPVCAIAINDGGGSQLLLDEFRVIEPQCGVGAVQTQTQTQPRPLKASMVSAPEQLSYANVLLIDLVCSETGDEICAAIEALAASGVALHNISVATLVGYASGLARVRHAFPQLNAVLTTKVMPPSSATSGGAANGRCSDPAADLTWLLHTRLTE